MQSVCKAVTCLYHAFKCTAVDCSASDTITNSDTKRKK